MRDLQHLEELSSAAALGLWADDIVLALDQALSSRRLNRGQAALLEEAAEMLDATLERAQQPLAAPKSTRALAATDTTLTAVAALARSEPGSDQRKLLSDMTKVLREAAAKELGAEDADRVRPAMQLFGLVGEQQLVASNSVLSSRKETRAWTETPATSSSS